MPESFDPDAWPHGGSSKPAKPSAEPAPRGNDDPYDAFGFADDPVDGTRPGNNSRNGHNGGTRPGDDYPGDNYPADKYPGDDDEDFASFSYDFDDEPAQQQPQPRRQSAAIGAAGSPRRNDYDDDPYVDDESTYDDSAPDRSRDLDDFGSTRFDSPRFDNDDRHDGRNYDDYDDDRGYNDQESYDDYGDFDREPSGGGGLKRTLVGVAAVAFLIGALGFLATFLFGGDDPPAEEAAPAPTAAPAQPETPAAQPGQTPTATPPSDVVDSLNTALTAWGEFSVTGDVTSVEPYFLPTSTQLQHFRTTEAPSIQANPPGGQPFRMTMGNDATVAQSGNGDWVIAGTVTAVRDAEPAQQFRWEFTMTRQTPSSPWQIMRVRQFS